MQTPIVAICATLATRKTKISGGLLVAVTDIPTVSIFFASCESALNEATFIIIEVYFSELYTVSFQCIE